MALVLQIISLNMVVIASNQKRASSVNLRWSRLALRPKIWGLGVRCLDAIKSMIVVEKGLWMDQLILLLAEFRLTGAHESQ